MNILVLNGSPKGEKSNTLKLTTAFLEGLNLGRNNSVQIITIAKEHLEPCRGCYCCWMKTPGKCMINDDMEELTQIYIKSDLIIWSFPLYCFNMPSKIKGFIDRLLPLTLPIVTINENNMDKRPQRYDFSCQRHILISTCGAHSIWGSYDALFWQFEIVFGGRLCKIICSGGELFRVPALAERISEYLSYVKKAGEEFAAQGILSLETQDKLSESLYPPEAYI